MNTIQLHNITSLDSKLKESVKGVFASNQLPPRVFTYPSAYIINTHPSYMPGEHWICIWFDNNTDGDFFYSFGNTPLSFDDDIAYFLFDNCSNYVYNNRAIQQYKSSTCGYYVLFYLLMKSRGQRMEDIISIFGGDKQTNDYFVVDFVNNNTIRD